MAGDDRININQEDDNPEKYSKEFRSDALMTMKQLNQFKEIINNYPNLAKDVKVIEFLKQLENAKNDRERFVIATQQHGGIKSQNLQPNDLLYHQLIENVLKSSDEAALLHDINSSADRIQSDVIMAKAKISVAEFNDKLGLNKSGGLLSSFTRSKDNLGMMKHEIEYASDDHSRYEKAKEQLQELENKKDIKPNENAYKWALKSLIQSAEKKAEADLKPSPQPKNK